MVNGIKQLPLWIKKNGSVQGSVYVFTNLSARAGCDTRSIFKWSLTGLNLVFTLLDWLPNQGKRTQSALLFTHNCGENNWIPAFPKGFSAIRNAILIQDLNLCRHVHFRQR